MRARQQLAAKNNSACALPCLAALALYLCSEPVFDWLRDWLGVRPRSCLRLRILYSRIIFLEGCMVEGCMKD